MIVVDLKSRMLLLPLLQAVVLQAIIAVCFGVVVDGAFVATSIRSMMTNRYCESMIHPRQYFTTATTLCPAIGPPTIWIEDAEEGFVDDDENLEEGEICLKSIEAYASSSLSSPSSSFHKMDDSDDDDDDDSPRFLCAGALVQRPIDTLLLQNCGDSSSSSTTTSSTSSIPIIVCDAWFADSVLNHGGPNLQVQGALQVLDDLFLFVLLEEGRRQRHHVTISEDNDNCRSNEYHHPQHTPIGEDDASIRALQSFVVQCGQPSNDIHQEHPSTCASFMATKARGFVPLKDVVSVTSIYSPHPYDNNLEGMVFDPALGRKRYQEAAAAAAASDGALPLDDSTATTSSSWLTAIHRILELLPDDASLRRHTTKRFSLRRRRRQ